MSVFKSYIEKGIELARKRRIRSGEQFVREGIEAVVAEIVAELHGAESDQITHLVHYTGTDVVFAMLDDRNARNVGNDQERHVAHEADYSDEEEDCADQAEDDGGEEHSGLRLYDTVHANDPEEGRFLLLHWPDGDDGPPWMWKERRNVSQEQESELGFRERVEQGLYPGHAYVLSFVPTTAEKRNNDRIVFWREYGRESAGCSLSIPNDKLFNDKKCSLTPYRVRYGQDGVDSLAEKLRERLFDPIEKGIRDAIGLESRMFDAVKEKVWQELQLFRYLYKDTAYDYEEEYRLVVVASGDEMPGNPTYEHKTNTRGDTVFRHYMRHPSLYSQQIFGSNTHVILGPTVPHAENVERTIDELLRRKGISGTTIKPSAIRYRGR